MSLAVGLALSLAAALVPIGCMIALLVSVARWTPRAGRPPGDDGGHGGIGTRPRAPRPHGSPERRCNRRAALDRGGRKTPAR